MTILKSETRDVANSDDITIIRQQVRKIMQEAGFSLVEITKMVTAASELARNVVVHGGGGQVTINVIDNDGHYGLQLIFEDNGPGIADIDKALQDGFTTGDGLGLGLGGAKRLVHEFSIHSQVGKGTRVEIIRWR
ncbi:MAG: ATP-binding protein [Spirochaetes bacterium]|nr:ATP-binding protein [Spirochaetota bacterium]